MFCQQANFYLWWTQWTFNCNKSTLIYIYIHTFRMLKQFNSSRLRFLYCEIMTKRTISRECCYRLDFDWFWKQWKLADVKHQYFRTPNKTYFSRVACFLIETKWNHVAVLTGYLPNHAFTGNGDVLWVQGWLDYFKHVLNWDNYQSLCERPPVFRQAGLQSSDSIFRQKKKIVDIVNWPNKSQICAQLAKTLTIQQHRPYHKYIVTKKK